MFFSQLKNLDLAELSQHLLSNVKPGALPLVISDILSQVNDGQTLLIVANDNDQTNNLLQEIAYLSPEINLHAFPEWDTIPYDRVSPSQEIMATRAQSLATLAKIKREGEKQKSCFITTYKALTQKVVQPNEFVFTQVTLRPGDECNYSDLIVQLNELGLERVDVVREPGSYAVRGGLIDVYPFDAHDPMRIDFFDNEIEALKTFDPMTQRSIESCPSISLGTATELSLTPKKVDHFKIKYIQSFGAKAGSDVIVSELLQGKHPQGIEHWLPLFHEKMVFLLDWFPKTTALIFDGMPEAAISNAYDQAVDYYTQRQENLGEKTEDNANLYRPVPYESFFMGWPQISKLASNFQQITLLPYDADSSLNLKIKTPVFPSKSPLKGFAEQIKTYDGLTVLSVGSEKQFQSILQGLNSLDINFSLKKNIANALKLRGKSSQQAFAVISPLKYSFRCDDFQVLTYQDLFGVRAPTNKNQRKNSEISIQDINAFEAGDHLVHRDHGVGRFVSMIVLELDGQEHDCLMLEYDEGAKLYVPVENLDVLSKYAGHNSDVALDRLGSVQWQNRVKRVKEKIFEVAGILMETAAKRTVVQKPRFDGSLPLYQEFCAQFPYEETADQKVAIEQVENDLGSDTPMDRLICGDVGFGKTEIAMRAAALTAFNGYQVLILVPTTVLAQQHEKNFQKRFADFDCRIAQLSRFVKPAEKKRTLEGLADGRVQILVATHAALSKKISFHNLGLIVIDEEQHFGVMQKEHLKTLSPNVNILSMSATPIPRTLQMAVAGMRGLSLIASPPIDRLAVRSQVMPYDGLIIREAILREVQRGGQIYFVCPRLKDLDVMERKLKKLIPHIRLGVGHGQLSAAELDSVMEDFYQGKFDVLLATNIVESGLDVPNANTLIVYRAEYFGLSQLYQLKGRIGRSKKRAYAFFMTENSTVMEKKAYKRLEVIQSLDRLGAGFSVASHDMDLRGAGNLVGKAQSGHIKEVGYELYQQYLNEAIETLKSSPTQEAKNSFLSPSLSLSPQINLGVQVSIPENYIPDLNLRVGIYRKLSELTNLDALARYQEELIDRFGDLPNSLKNLIGTIHLKILAVDLNISKIEKGTKAVAISFNSQIPENIEKIVELVTKNPARFQLKPSGKLLCMFNEKEKEDILESMIKTLDDLYNTCSV
ncbi:MAG: transcription-repair coupling factor [Rickettsiales bacterium]|nr:transcription-repair coupling factor [Rickettsiales bacterium]